MGCNPRKNGWFRNKFVISTEAQRSGEICGFVCSQADSFEAEPESWVI
jgi:hypothetical protein